MVLMSNLWLLGTFYGALLDNMLCSSINCTNRSIVGGSREQEAVKLMTKPNKKSPLCPKIDSCWLHLIQTQVEYLLASEGDPQGFNLYAVYNTVHITVFRWQATSFKVRKFHEGHMAKYWNLTTASVISIYISKHPRNHWRVAKSIIDQFVCLRWNFQSWPSCSVNIPL